MFKHRRMATPSGGSPSPLPPWQQPTLQQPRPETRRAPCRWAAGTALRPTRRLHGWRRASGLSWTVPNCLTLPPSTSPGEAPQGSYDARWLHGMCPGEVLHREVAESQTIAGDVPARQAARKARCITECWVEPAGDCDGPGSVALLCNRPSVHSLRRYCCCITFVAI